MTETSRIKQGCSDRIIPVEAGLDSLGKQALTDTRTQPHEIDVGGCIFLQLVARTIILTSNCKEQLNVSG
jgi:hypothetical protein